MAYSLLLKLGSYELHSALSYDAEPIVIKEPTETPKRPKITQMEHPANTLQQAGVFIMFVFMNTHVLRQPIIPAQKEPNPSIPFTPPAMPYTAFTSVSAALVVMGAV